MIERPAADDPENLNSDQADRLIPQTAAHVDRDTKFLVDELQQLNGDSSSKFARRLDLQRLGMFGPSFGGATALQFCHDDFRCKAGIDIDGAPFGSIVQDGLKG